MFLRDDLKALFSQWAAIMSENRDYLIDLDRVAGDGDLGLTMSDGFTAAATALNETTETDLGMMIYLAGKVMLISVPSTMGTLIAAGFMSSGKQLRGRLELGLNDLYILFDSFMKGIVNLGKAKIGEKTILDGLAPAVEQFQIGVINKSSISKTVSAAADSASRGFLNTATLIAVHGRAAKHGEKSRSLLDPGAAVAMLMMQAFASYINSVE